jgi:NosR/NirI family nitrous oxide reductase transcriptional regulator
MSGEVARKRGLAPPSASTPLAPAQSGRCLSPFSRKLGRIGAVGCLVLLLAAVSPATAVERFRPPDFTKHKLPEPTTPEPPAPFWDYLDLGYLVVALGLATHLALVRRSRRGLVALSVISLAWLGFRRDGCICPIGAIQNVAEAVANPNYVVPFSVVAFFALPILVALFFGRTFCAAVCPLGAVQELVAVRPLRTPRWLDHCLGLLPYVYLGAAVVFATTGVGEDRAPYVICKYDPFVGFFRMSASATMLALGLGFLVLGLFVGRPYCRYLCPYGAILKLCSRVSKRHVRIPPEECIKCKLCEDACPYGAILQPTVEQSPRERLKGRRRLAVLLAVFPLVLSVGAVLGRFSGVALSRLHPRAALAELVAGGPSDAQADIDKIEAFLNTRQPPEELYAEVRALHDQFAQAGAWLGGWIGLVIGIKLIHLSIRRRRDEYQPDRGNCVSCGRCFWYCPEEQVRLGLIQQIRNANSETRNKLQLSNPQ